MERQAILDRDMLAFERGVGEIKEGREHYSWLLAFERTDILLHMHCCTIITKKLLSHARLYSHQNSTKSPSHSVNTHINFHHATAPPTRQT